MARTRPLTRFRPLRLILDGFALLIVLASLLYAAVVVTNRIRPDLLPSGQNDDDARFARFMALADSGTWIGDRDAPVVLVVYNDYACGFCQQLHRTLQVLRRRYPDHLAVVIKHFFPKPELAVLKVTLGAECANQQGAFESYHNAAFENPRAVHYATGWRTIGLAAHLPDMQDFQQCVESFRHAARIEHDTREGQSLNVTGTPTLLVNGRRVDGMPPLAALDSLIALQFPGRGIGGTH